MHMRETYPLQSISLEQAKMLQFKAVDAVTRHFNGLDVLSLGDLGVRQPGNKPDQTVRAEQVFADVFDAERALFVRGAGTAAIRWALLGCMQPAGTVLVHDAPIYPTTKVTLDAMAAKIVRIDYNDLNAVKTALADDALALDAAIVQHTRQKLDDRYDMGAVIAAIKNARPDLPIVTDDNYAALKTGAIGCELGADIATFSCFKVLGPEGIGVLVGRRAYIDRVEKMQYSGGSQVQGHEAMAAVRGLIYAPVSLAISAEVTDALCARINAGALAGAKRAYIANAQSKVLLVELERDIAPAVITASERLGAAPHPVGSESKYEFAPMVYRVSGTFREQDSTLEKRMIRINPMRAGADTVLRILRQAISDATESNENE